MASTAAFVAVHHVQHALGHARLDGQLGQAHRYGRVALGRLEDEGVAHGDGRRQHPQRDHGREVERRDAGDHAQGLAQGIDVDPRPRALGVFALGQARDAADEFHHVQAPLDVALGVGHHLAVLGGQQHGQLVHVGLDQALELEHDARAPLRVQRRPARLRRLGAGHGPAQQGCVRERQLRLRLADVRVEHRVRAALTPMGRAIDEMGNGAHRRAPPRDLSLSKHARARGQAVDSAIDAAHASRAPPIQTREGDRERVRCTRKPLCQKRNIRNRRLPDWNTSPCYGAAPSMALSAVASPLNRARACARAWACLSFSPSTP